MTQNRGKYSHNGNADPLFRVYLREMNGYSLLTPEEEKSLAIRYRETGDREATHKLVTGSLRLVVKIVLDIQKEFKRKGRKFPEQLLMDLIQEGNLGLIWAVEKFDPYNGAKLSSYSSIWIEKIGPGYSTWMSHGRRAPRRATWTFSSTLVPERMMPWRRTSSSSFSAKE
jgi:DNA-directed RNA polymerase sigma subunit (sigma70/sigma32)